LPLVRSSDYGIFLVELKKSRKKNPPLKIPLRVNDFGVLDILADCTSNTNKKGKKRERRSWESFEQPDPNHLENDELLHYAGCQKGHIPSRHYTTV
jgi:hypothetical protein